MAYPMEHHTGYYLEFPGNKPWDISRGILWCTLWGTHGIYPIGYIMSGPIGCDIHSTEGIMGYSMGRLTECLMEEANPPWKNPPPPSDAHYWYVIFLR